MNNICRLGLAWHTVSPQQTLVMIIISIDIIRSNKTNLFINFIL